MRRIVVLTAGFGEGHNSAARNVCDALNLKPGVSATVHDPLMTLGERYESAKKRYLEMITLAPGLWRIAYHALDRLPLAPMSLPFLRRVENHLANILAESGADTAVCTYPLYQWMLRRISKRTGKTVKVVTIVTDSITINRVWAKAPSDLWLTADRFSAKRLAGLGVSAGRIHASGFPVPLRFTRPAGETRPEPLRDGAPARVLLMAGTAARDTVKTARAIAALPGVELTVTVGRNAGLGETVRQALADTGHRAAIIGWTDLMPDLLRSHHIVLGKAGGATTHETLAARTPFVMTHVLPGQEEGNARLLARFDVGEVARTPAAAARAVSAMLRDDAQVWRERVGRIEKLTRTDGAIRAAEAILG
jgi:processive 1,2-diacylglycerol beta-glucosyltransferase